MDGAALAEHLRADAHVVGQELALEAREQHVDRLEVMTERSQALEVRLQPRARANQIVGERGGVVSARVTAPPLEGRANEALRRLIARAVGVSVSRVQIVSGERGRHKLVRVEGFGAERLRAALLASAGGARRPKRRD
jgi:uncharacterized protein